MQPDLFSRLPPHDGVTFDPKQDAVRLNRQQQRVQSYMRMMYPNWVSLSTISIDTDIPEASVSARLRDLRKPRFGNWDVQKKRVEGGRGLWVYRVKG